MPNPVCALAMPFRCVPGIDPEAVSIGVMNKASKSGCIDFAPGQAWTSLLPYTFNLLWTGFLNQRAQFGIKYFAMIHDDIRPQPGWLDVLIDELERTDSDLVSGVVPIKDTRGLVSTAVDNTGDEWNPKRLTLTEVFAMPETFGDEDAGGPLLLNTGIWVCKFDRPWCEKVWFRQQDALRRDKDGNYEAHTIPEDWDFSRQVRAQGGKLMGTRKVQLSHERGEWHNNFPWGKWKSDEDGAKYLAAPSLPLGAVNPPVEAIAA